MNPKFFTEYGYSRYKCVKCGEYFWSKIPRKVCPDRPCSKYEFLMKEYPSIPRISLDEARSKFINYFTRNNHGYMDPYPVLARWRNDLYLTIASIIVFQPAVTEGIVDPPYNPLVIVQPSIRLEDIDNVGLTFGRHLTSFEMGGHHAFNKEDQWIYWVNETLKYSYEFFTKEIGIPPEDLVFKESWWEGGGNAGPAFEVVVDGMELATLVFMKYKVIGDKRELNPVRVVDTGYGIERIAWFTRRDPTSFHTIYGELVDEFKNILSVEEPPYNVLEKIVYELSDQEINGLEYLEKILLEKGYSEYFGELVRSLYLYTLLDHTKTISLMLSDGIVPSNVGEGYLARLVIRRALKTLILLGFDASRLEEVFIELLSRQAKYWKNKYVYDKFSKHIDYIIDVSRHETRRFIDAVERGIRIVEKRLRKKKDLTINDLVEIYDSYGIPPEIVAEKAGKYGINIRVPPDFYSMIAEKHGGSRKLVKEKEHLVSESIVEWAKEYPPTRRLFHEDPYMRSFNAKILGVKDNYVILDQTLFYPKAGGQDHDTGYIVVDGERYYVKASYKAGDVIVHELDRKIEDRYVGAQINGLIDWRRRYRLMRHHTATHIVLGAARKVLGDHVWQAGAEKTLEKARLDITHYKLPSRDEIKKIEEEANRIIDEHIDLKFHYLPKFEAEKRYGLRIYQGGAVLSPILRIVEIPGWDAEACFGTHVYNTSEIGGIKIVNVEKIQDGVVRLEYIASTKLPEYIDKLSTEIEEALKIIGLEHGSIIEAVKRVKKKNDEYRELISQYRRILKKTIIDNALSKKRVLCGIPVATIIEEVNDKTLYREILEELSLKQKNLVVLISDKLLELAIDPGLAKSKGIDLRKIVHRLKQLGGRGGGKPDHVTIRIDKPVKYLELIMKIIAETICGEEQA